MKISKFITVIMLAFCSMLVLSCNDVCSCKKVSCPAYNNAYFDLWFPYTQSQQIVFTDTAQPSNNDTIIISNISATQSYEANKGCGERTAGCNTDKYIYSLAFSAGYNSSSDWNNVKTDSNYTLSVHEFLVNAKGLTATGFVNTTLPAEFNSAINIGGKNYENVQTIFSIDTAGLKDHVYQVYLQKGTGLLAYRFYPSHALFVKK